MIEAWKILKEYRVTEKASFLVANRNCYTFEVICDANKMEIADAVKAAFKVEVEKVCILNRKPKIKRSRMRKTLPGAVGGMKKAMVVLKKGSKIDIIKG